MAFDETRRVLFEFIGESGDLQQELRGTARDAGKADKASGGFANTLSTKVKPAAIAAGAAAAAAAAKWAVDGIAMAETAEVVAVTVATPPASGIDALSMLSVTVGGSSSSVIVTVACCSPDSLPLTTPVTSMTTVSSPSINASSTPVIEAVAVVEPAGTRISGSSIHAAKNGRAAPRLRI